MERNLTELNKRKNTCSYCKESVGENLTFKEVLLHSKRKLNGKGGFFHHDCYEKYIEEAFVEEYKGNIIYKIDGVFIPYFGCPYYFYTLEECKARIDLKCVGFYPCSTH